MNIPQSVKNCLWSYDISKLDFEKNADLIIFNVLNYGTLESINWLFQNYTKEQILESFKKTYRSAWSKKSLNYWQIIFGYNLQTKTRAEYLQGII